MNLRQLLELVVLAALWGASFLFMRIGAPEMGPIGLIAIRTLVAGLFLLPFLFFYNSHRGVRRHVPAIALVGIIGSAMPFVLIAYATLTVTAGYASILNATTPMFGALVAWAWLGDRLKPSGIIWLLIGFAGVIVLVWGRGEMPTLQLGTAVAAALTHRTRPELVDERLDAVAATAPALGPRSSSASTVRMPAPLAHEERGQNLWDTLRADPLGRSRPRRIKRIPLPGILKSVLLETPRKVGTKCRQSRSQLGSDQPIARNVAVSATRFRGRCPCESDAS